MHQLQLQIDNKNNQILRHHLIAKTKLMITQMMILKILCNLNFN